MSDFNLIQRPRRLRKSASMRELFQESHLSLNDLALPIFVEEGVDDYVPINAMPGVMRIPENVWRTKSNASPKPVSVRS